MTATEPKMIARKAHNPRNGHYYSLCVINEGTGNALEFARIRMESGGWNVWANDRDEQRVYQHHVSQAGRNQPLHVALAAVREGVRDWQS